MKSNISTADMIFISVNTPTKAKGVGGAAIDLKWVESLLEKLVGMQKERQLL